MNDLFAVVEHNQASGQPVGDFVSFCISLAEAAGEQNRLTERNRADGRREQYAIYRLDEVEEDELWEWSAHSPTGERAFISSDEWAVRRYLPDGHQVVKRRLGTTDWIPAPKEDES